ncbi:MAG TPA: clan AA aspartic protease [Verrucomicrobiae bacterium]
MGYAHAKITLQNPRLPSLSPIEVDSLADTGSLHLCIPEHLAIQLQLQEIYKREVTTADGRRHLVPYVGPLQITFGNRGCFGGAIVRGDQVLLGAVQMEDMDLIVSPPERKVLPNPNSPNMPTALAKGLT